MDTQRKTNTVKNRLLPSRKKTTKKMKNVIMEFCKTIHIAFMFVVVLYIFLKETNVPGRDETSTISVACHCLFHISVNGIEIS